MVGEDAGCSQKGVGVVVRALGCGPRAVSSKLLYSSSSKSMPLKTTKREEEKEENDDDKRQATACRRLAAAGSSRCSCLDIALAMSFTLGVLGYCKKASVGLCAQCWPSVNSTPAAKPS